jgi:hypothetical protein
MELNLRYKNASDKSLYIQDNRALINKLLEDGVPVQRILSILGVDNYRFSLFFSTKPTQSMLGHKNDTYFEEEELLNNNFNFKFNDLSYDEQKFYLEREKTGVLGRYFANTNGLHGGREGRFSDDLQETGKEVGQ